MKAGPTAPKSVDHDTASGAIVPSKRWFPQLGRNRAPTRVEPSPLDDAAYQAAFTDFWDGMQRPDGAKRIEQVLRPLNNLQRWRLLQSPNAPFSVDSAFEPHLPLCVAAFYGRVDLIPPLMTFGAHPSWGDRSFVDGEPSYTPAFWAAAQGEIQALKLLLKKCPSLAEPLRGLCTKTHPATAKLLRKEGVGSEEMGTPLKLAILREIEDEDTFDPEAIRILVLDGGADPDRLYELPPEEITETPEVTARPRTGPATAPPAPKPRYATALGFALHHGCWASAAQLIHLGAKVQGSKKHDGKLDQIDTRAPIATAVRGNQLALVAQLLEHDAPTHPALLKIAIEPSRGSEATEQSGPAEADAQAMYLRLYRAGCVPDKAEISEIYAAARSRGFEQLTFFISLQWNLLRMTGDKLLPTDLVDPQIWEMQRKIDEVASAMEAPNATEQYFGLTQYAEPNVEDQLDLVRRGKWGRMSRLVQRRAQVVKQVVTSVPSQVMDLAVVPRVRG